MAQKETGGLIKRAWQTRTSHAARETAERFKQQAHGSKTEDIECAPAPESGVTECCSSWLTRQLQREFSVLILDGISKQRYP